MLLGNLTFTICFNTVQKRYINYSFVVAKVNMRCPREGGNTIPLNVNVLCRMKRESRYFR